MNKQVIQRKCQCLMGLIRDRPAYLSEKDAIPVLSKAVVNGNNILRQTASQEESVDVSVEVLCDYAQLLLDFSYAIELKIVNDEFAGDYKGNIQHVFNYLDEAIDVIKPLHTKLREDNSKGNTKIHELVECLYWRKGALSYMYCHTAYNNQSSFLSNQTLKDQFISMASNGVTFLAVDMKNARREETTQEYEASDDQILQLVKQGIFGHVNMLSLMYAAEMCYWISLVADTTGCSRLKFSPPTLGVRLANQYINLADGPLKESSWNTQQAIKINKHFQS